MTGRPEKSEFLPAYQYRPSWDVRPVMAYTLQARGREWPIRTDTDGSITAHGHATAAYIAQVEGTSFTEVTVVNVAPYVAPTKFHPHRAHRAIHPTQVREITP